ncbi:YegJ family protein [Chitinimonas koreensis]|uniref:YegJ family protein n=1 Tax=Chitinimonas koreensis TaxID=356302 RepID=UPI0004909D6E|nr:DUF2314 domain-containing protein [Chitinimonas koreensis]QNM96640.1 DUF2314 domain-containing protein [Chitinimonas koreensis]
MIRPLILVLALSISCHAADEKVEDRPIRIDQTDRDMNSAIAKARSTLDDFLKLADHPPAGSSGFKVKVMFRDRNGTEHFWVTPFKRYADRFAGVVANEPSVVTSVELGKVYPFTRDQITDWGYEKNGKQIGSYTVCVLFKKMPADEVARYKKDHGFECRDQ